MPRGGKRLELAMPNGDWRPGRRLTCGVGITGAEMARRAVAVKTSASRRVRRQGESDALELFFSSVVGKKKNHVTRVLPLRSRHVTRDFILFGRGYGSHVLHNRYCPKLRNESSSLGPLFWCLVLIRTTNAAAIRRTQPANRVRGPRKAAAYMMYGCHHPCS